MTEELSLDRRLRHKPRFPFDRQGIRQWTALASWIAKDPEKTILATLERATATKKGLSRSEAEPDLLDVETAIQSPTHSSSRVPE